METAEENPRSKGFTGFSCSLDFLASGFKGWAYMNWSKPHWSKPYQFTLSRRAVQSPVIPIPITGSPGRSLLALSHQYAKGGVSSNYGSRSYTQASPSGSDFASWASPQNGRNLGCTLGCTTAKTTGFLQFKYPGCIGRPVIGHGSYKYTASGDRSRPQSASRSAPFSTLGAGTYSGTYTSGKAVPQSSSLTPSKVSSMTLPWGPSQFGLSSSQSASSPSYAIISSAQSPSRMSNRDSSYTFGSQGPQLPASRRIAYSSSSRFTSGSPPYVTMSKAAPQYAQSVHHVPKFQSQTSQRRHSYASSLTRGIQASGPQSSTSPQNSQIMSSRYTPVSSTYVKLAVSPLDVSSQSSSVQSRVGSQTSAYSHVLEQGRGQGASSLHASSLSLGGNVPASSLYNQAIPTGSSQQPSASRLTQSTQTSGTAVLKSSSLSQSSQIPSRSSSMSSAGNSSQLVSAQGEGSSFSGLSSHSVSISCPFMPVKRSYTIP